MKSVWILFLREGFIKQSFYYAHLFCVSGIWTGDTEMLAFASWPVSSGRLKSRYNLMARGWPSPKGISTLTVAIFGESNQFIIKDITQEQPNGKATQGMEWGRGVELPLTLPPPSSLMWSITKKLLCLNFFKWTLCFWILTNITFLFCIIISCISPHSLPEYQEQVFPNLVFFSSLSHGNKTPWPMQNNLDLTICTDHSWNQKLWLDCWLADSPKQAGEGSDIQTGLQLSF